MSRYIDADAFKESINNCDICDICPDRAVRCSYGCDFPDAMTLKWEILIDAQPSIDIVRCQDCKYWVYNFNGCSRNPCTEPWYATDFCNYGEREGE